jgi:hypothetical protein
MKPSEVGNANLPAGNEITIEGILHSDTDNVWMNDESREEEEQVIVFDSRINPLLLENFPPRLGGRFAYYYPCRLQGILGFDENKTPTVGEISELELEVKGERRKLI